MPDENDVDESLFPDKETEAEVAAMWEGGQKANAVTKPVGTFQAVIKEAAVGPSSGGDRYQIHYELEILIGDSKGVVLHKYDGLGSEQQSQITQNQLRRVGIDTKRVSLKTLPAVLLGLKDKKVVINCRQKDDFHNIFFQKLITETGATSPRTGTTSNTRAPAGRTSAATGAAKGGGRKFG